jgi:hypothetical protein
MSGQPSPNTSWPFGGAAIQIAPSAKRGPWLARQRDLDRRRKSDQQDIGAWGARRMCCFFQKTGDWEHAAHRMFHQVVSAQNGQKSWAKRIGTVSSGPTFATWACSRYRRHFTCRNRPAERHTARIELSLGAQSASVAGLPTPTAPPAGTVATNLWRTGLGRL